MEGHQMNTPRTDANIHPSSTAGHELVKADFARGLELELEQTVNQCLALIAEVDELNQRNTQP